MSEAAPDDPDLARIVADEEHCLTRVVEHLQGTRTRTAPEHKRDYDEELLSLRDQIATARLEDVPPLVEQMERLQMLAAHRKKTVAGTADPRSPYFGRLVLAEGGRRREVLIGRSTYLDADAAVRIVDWRDAPVSRLYYRYEQGEEYVETFGEREVEGEVAVRRSVAITESIVRRITAPEGTFIHRRTGGWERGGFGTSLAGGQGTATRAAQHHAPGKLGVGTEDDGREDKHLREITALIDPRQFELITRPDSGLVVIQGGAGSGKTTIGLHRMAYLAYNDPRRFRTERMLVVVFNDALARYVSYVLPALGVEGVLVRTYYDWATRQRLVHVPNLTKEHTDETPGVVTRMKKHPAMLRAIDDHVASIVQRVDDDIQAALAREPCGDAGAALAGYWRARADRPLGQRAAALAAHLAGEGKKGLPGGVLRGLEGVFAAARTQAEDIVNVWADLVTDRETLALAMHRYAPGAFTEREIDQVHGWCTSRCLRVLDELDTDDDGTSDQGIDGQALREPAALDHEDETLLVRIYQRLCGPLLKGRGKKEALVYEHVLVDEAQDLSPVELAVVIDTVSNARSVTLAGDVAQRLFLDNGFTDWKGVLGELGMDHVEIEPLQLAYRSTKEIIDVATAVLGPLASPDAPIALRSGAPVELFAFAQTGDAVGFLAEALRGLAKSEPLASIAVIARFPEHADAYYAGLVKAEVPYCRRISDQDFPFKPGVDVTDVRQVKGLEFDYVIIVEASTQVYPTDDESRHLLHIATTRAAHQLWFITTATPSELLPEALREKSL